MTLTSRTTLVIVCDVCSAETRPSGDREALLTHMLAEGWGYDMATDRHYCPDCNRDRRGWA